ncbi:RNA polymerase sigma factor [Microtetraspora niveoalba]|uniref:RNA polymerase sigma factor n=1 Tax=Microtetraspora niveoalba TaxID=46175 RepID=UPI000834F553|nr:sigma-70 family RNA polymerase sigma factor [Microtetraspora niveoalba]
MFAEKTFPVPDQAAWEELVTRFGGRMWAVARACGLGPADAADAVQGAWLRMVESLDAIRDPERIGAWLVTTTRHEAVRLARRARGERPAADRLPELLAPDPAAPDPAASVADADYGRRLWSRLEGLAEPCRSLLRLYALNPDAKYAQISMRLGLPMGSIGPTRSRCMSRLRALIEEER